ncbi:hypothetical protein ACIBSV_14740 [Embleya sp. NPDC050154]|uniref:hypothetical protein n=1 Tax=Embleya sp. NPDC050154 TaxID=3363988 RepID=UPI0037B65C11
MTPHHDLLVEELREALDGRVAPVVLAGVLADLKEALEPYLEEAYADGFGDGWREGVAAGGGSAEYAPVPGGDSSLPHLELIVPSAAEMRNLPASGRFSGRAEHGVGGRRPGRRRQRVAEADGE